MVLLNSVQGADCAPLLQDGKKTLYQRVVSHPGAQLYADASESSDVVNRALKTFTVLYVYERNHQDQKLLVVCSFTDKSVRFTAPEGMDLSKAKLVLQNYDVAYNSNVFLTKPYEMRVYLL